MKQEQFESITKWQKETFGESTALSKLHHLNEEIGELHKELLIKKHKTDFGSATDDDLPLRMELSDCFILLAGVASSSGYSYDEIIEMIDDKMAINR